MTVTSAFVCECIHDLTLWAEPVSTRGDLCAKGLLSHICPTPESTPV
jgi:hypothetical protein